MYLKNDTESMRNQDMKYRNIIFDFDGTLVDTAALIIETMHRTIDALNLPYKTDAECKAMIGYRLEAIAILTPSRCIVSRVSRTPGYK